MMVATKEGTEQLLGYAALHYDNKGFSSLGLRDHINRRGLWKGFLGWVSLNIVASPTQPNEVMVSMLAVSPESRGLGVGTRLLSEVEKLALENKKHQLRLEVVSDNLDAQRLYERFGFQVTHTQSTYGLFSFPAVHTMVKKLDASQNDATKF
jgi:ribosomal protein S18 acetylase RimI-like enzyme